VVGPAILAAIALPSCAYAQNEEPASRGPLCDDGDPDTTSDDDAADA
jgi:hypothetical protein